jgi:hypothetical protein
MLSQNVALVQRETSPLLQTGDGAMLSDGVQDLFGTADEL